MLVSRRRVETVDFHEQEEMIFFVWEVECMANGTDVNRTVTDYGSDLAISIQTIHVYMHEQALSTTRNILQLQYSPDFVYISS